VQDRLLRTSEVSEECESQTREGVADVGMAVFPESVEGTLSSSGIGKLLARRAREETVPGRWIEALSSFKTPIVRDFGSFEILFEDTGRESSFLDAIVASYVASFVGGVFSSCTAVVRVVRLRDALLGLCVSSSRGTDMDGLSEPGLKGFDWLCDRLCSVVVIAVMLDLATVGLLARELPSKPLAMLCTDFGDAIATALGTGS